MVTLRLVCLPFYMLIFLGYKKCQRISPEFPCVSRARYAGCLYKAVLAQMCRGCMNTYLVIY